MEPVTLASAGYLYRFVAGKTGNDQGFAKSSGRNGEEKIWNVSIQADLSRARTIF